MKFASREELASFIRDEVAKAAKGPPGPHVTTGPVGRDSDGYSIGRAAALAVGRLDPSQAKEEARVSERLKKMYSQAGVRVGPNSVLVPTAGRLQPDEAIGAEIDAMTRAAGKRYDPDEARWAFARVAGYDRKALSAGAFTAGASLLAGTAGIDFIDVQRNYEVFASAGATEVGLNETGGFTVPRLSAAAAAYWPGEAGTISESQPTTGSLTLQAKRLSVLVRLNNEMLKFGGPTVDHIVRHDMARAAAVKADLAMLEGSGGTQIKGVITYGGIVTHAATGTGANGDTFLPQDLGTMEGKLPDGTHDGAAWVMRPNVFGALMNRRADAVTAGDGRGGFLFAPLRSTDARGRVTLAGLPVVRSSQVSGTRAKGSGSALTYLLLGHFPDWTIGRLGVMEFRAGDDDVTMGKDQTLLRGTQYIDAGPRNPASFVLCDQLLQG